MNTGIYHGFSLNEKDGKKGEEDLLTVLNKLLIKKRIERENILGQFSYYIPPHDLFFFKDLVNLSYF